MNVIEAAIFGLVQGVTEFLPVSSSGHLALYGALVGDAGGRSPMGMSVLVHVASLIAILVVFRREVRRLFFEDRRLGLFLCVGTVPAVVAGLAFGDAVERLNGRPAWVAVFLMITGLVLIAGEWVARRRRSIGTEQEMGLRRVLAVGVAQAAALLPGISRSGMTISAGRALGLGREASVRFSFLLAVPAIAGAGGYELAKGMKAGAVGMAPGPSAAAFAAALISSWLALVLLIRIVRRAGLWVFSPYCLVAGGAALAYFGWR